MVPVVQEPCSVRAADAKTRQAGCHHVMTRSPQAMAVMTPENMSVTQGMCVLNEHTNGAFPRRSSQHAEGSSASLLRTQILKVCISKEAFINAKPPRDSTSGYYDVHASDCRPQLSGTHAPKNHPMPSSNSQPFPTALAVHNAKPQEEPP